MAPTMAASMGRTVPKIITTERLLERLHRAESAIGFDEIVEGHRTVGP
jgi:hypothetical protein